MIVQNGLSECNNPVQTIFDEVEEKPVTSAPCPWRLTVLNSLSEALPYWQHLRTAGCRNPYQSSEWLSSWFETIGKERKIEVAIAVVQIEEKPVAILPFALERGGLASTLTFLGHQNGNQNTGLWDPSFYCEVTKTQIEDILRNVQKQTGADVFSLSNIPEHWHGRPHPFLSAAATQSPSPIFVQDLPETFDTFFRETHSKSSRKNLLRKQRHLQATGDYRFGKAVEPDEINRAFRAFLDQREKRAGEAGIPNAFSNPVAQDFLAQLLGLKPFASGEATKSMDIWFLETGGAIRATYLCVEQDSTLYAYSNSVAHDDMLPNSPGLVLIKEIIEYACGSPQIEVLDLGLGEERYKTAWTKAVPLKDLALAFTWKGILRQKQDALRLRIKTGIRNSDALWPLVRRLRKLKAGLGNRG